MSGPHAIRRGEEQWQDWLDGELPEDQHEALATALGEEAAAQRAVDLYQAHRLLGLVHADDGDRFVGATIRRLPAGKGFSDEVMAHIDRLHPRPRWPRSVAWAAAALLMIALGLGGWLALQPPPAPVATLVAGQDARWSGLQPMDGARLPPGAYQLTDGRALIHGDGGAQIAVTAPARFILHTAERVSVLAGTIALRLDAGSHGFTITTAVGDIVDRGTEFVVRIAAEGTEVHVIAGRVICVRTDAPTSELVAGQALRLRSPSDPGETIPLGALDFDQALPTRIAEAAAAGLTAYDGFAYRPNDDALRDGGTGWSGAWQRGVSGLDAEPLTMLAQGLGPAGQAVSGRALVLAGVRQTTLKRTLMEPLAAGRAGTHYLSFLYRLDQPAGERSAQVEDTLRVALVSSDDGERIGLGLRAGHPYLAGVSEVSPLSVETGRLQRVILRLTGNADGSEESALLMLPAEATPAVEPATWHITSALHRRSAALVRLELGFAAGSRSVVDEVRLGATWATVAGALPAATP